MRKLEHKAMNKNNYGITGTELTDFLPHMMMGDIFFNKQLVFISLYITVT